MSAILQALYEYAIDNSGKFPRTLQPLFMADVEGKPPLDPWQGEYQYAPPTPEHPQPRVWSFGADGKLGGTGEDADIDSDQLRESDE